MEKAIEYDYVEYGRTVHYVPENTIYLDVGNTFAPGVIDHHHLKGHEVCSSATRMIWALLCDENSVLWENAEETKLKIDRMAEDNAATVRILTHVNPDLDSFVSSFILSYYLKEGRTPPIPENIIAMVDMADRGVFDDSFIEPNVYIALEVMEKDLKRLKGNERFEALRERFFGFLDSLISSGKTDVEYIQGSEIGEQCTALLRNITNPNDQEEKIKIPAFVLKGDKFSIQERDVTWIGIETDKVFNITKAKYRRKDGPVWSVYYPEKLNNGKHRLVLSVDRNERYALFGYGWRLERLERQYRNKNETSQGEKYPGYPVRKGPPRDGFDGPDPWWDGRNSDFTIVDSPNSGTVLGELGKEGLLSALGAHNEGWNRDFADAILDYLTRIFQGMSKGRDLDEELRWAMALYLAIKAYVKNDRSALERLEEGIAGLALLYPKGMEPVRGFLPDLGKKLAGLGEDQDLRPDIGRFLLASSGFGAFDAALTFRLRLAGKSDPKIKGILSSIEKLGSRRHLALLKHVTPLAIYLFKRHREVPALPPFYRISEYAELLRQLQEWKKGEGCAVWTGLRRLCDLPEKKLIAQIGINNQLLLTIRSARERLELPFLLKELESNLEGMMALDGRSDDEGDLEFIRIALSWHELTLCLSGSNERFCKRCTLCEDNIPAYQPPALKTCLKLESLCENCSGIPQGLYPWIQNLKETAGLITRFFNNQDQHPMLMLSQARKVLEQVGVLEDELNNSREVAAVRFPWVEVVIENCVGDVRIFFSRVTERLAAFVENIETEEIEQAAAWGKNLLRSLTVEQVYDLQADLLPEALKKLLSGEVSELESIRKIRARFREAPREGSTLRPGQNELADYLRRLYDSNHEELMDLPTTIKKNLFGRTVAFLQEKMCVGLSADLLDAFQARKRKVIPVLGPLFMLPFSAGSSLRTIFSAWTPLAAGFLAVLFTYRPGGFNSFSWFSLLFSAWLLGALFQFLGSGRWLGRGFEKMDDLEEEEKAAEQNGPPEHKEKQREKPLGSLVSGQLLMRFTVPMILALSPFVMSDELKEFIYLQIDSPGRFFSIIVIFGAFSLLALVKLQPSRMKGKTKNLMRLFGTLWVQAFAFSYFLPISLQNSPLISRAGNLLPDTISGIPRMVNLEIFGAKIYAFPAAAVIFSFMCLFAAIFIEGLVKET